MPNCIVSTCPYRTGQKKDYPDITLHGFPDNLPQIKKWLIQTGDFYGDIDKFAKRVLDGKKSGLYRMCSAHFTKDCYVMKGQKIMLGKNALPTLFKFHRRESGCKETHQSPPRKRLRPDEEEASTSAPVTYKSYKNTGTQTEARFRVRDSYTNTDSWQWIRSINTQTDPAPEKKHMQVQYEDDPDPVEFWKIKLDHFYACKISTSLKQIPDHAVRSCEGGSCLQQRKPCADLTRSLRMDKDRNNMTERILNLTLQIICLLTGENFTVKMSGEHVTPSSHLFVSGGLSRTQSPVMEPPPHSLKQERNHDRTILELTSKIIHLLTGEEWEHLERQKDLDLVMETQQPLESPDITKTRNISGELHTTFSSPACVNEDHSIVKNIQPAKSTDEQNMINCLENPIKEEPAFCEEVNIPDTGICTPGAQTQYSHIKEEPKSCEEGNLPDPEMCPTTDYTHTVYTSTYIKEEPVSREEGNLADSMDYTQTEYTSAHIKEETASWEEGNRMTADIDTPIDEAEPQYSSIQIKDEPLYEEGNLRDIDIHTSTGHTQTQCTADSFRSTFHRH